MYYSKTKLWRSESSVLKRALDPNVAIILNSAHEGEVEAQTFPCSE